MQVELGSALLSNPHTYSLSVLALCAFGLTGRHRVLVDDRAAWDRWAKTLPDALADEAQLVWDQGEQAASLGPASLRVAVGPTNPGDLLADPIVVTPVLALAMLGRPLRLLLENGRNDRAFLLAFCDAATRKALSDAEREGWLVFDSAGGIGELKIRLEAALHGLSDDAARTDALRTLYLCDSDAREVGVPSDDAKSIANALVRLHRIFGRHLRRQGSPARSLGWILGRRAAENYAPPSEVLRWAQAKHGSSSASLIQQASTRQGRLALQNGPGGSGTTRRTLLAAVALRELPEDVRSVLCMKKGRWKEKAMPGQTERTTQAVWDRLDDFQAAALFDGFGDTFSEEFYGQAQHLGDESGELVEVLKQVLERL
jgi:hypothetical protein